MTEIDKHPVEIITSDNKIDKYKLLKKELWLYMQGFTKNNSHVKDTMKIFFRHLENMIWGKEVDINEFGYL